MTIKNLNDPKIEQFVKDLLAKNEYSPENQMNSYINYINLVSKRMSEVGVTFSAVQSTLKAMNPVPPKIYNPATPFLPPPIGGGLVTDSLDVPNASFPSPLSAIKKDIILDAINGNLVQPSLGTLKFENPVKTRFPGNKTHEQLHNELNLYSEKLNRNQNEFFDIENPHLTGKSGMKTVEPINGVRYDVPDYEKIFDRKRFGPGFLNEERGAEFFHPKPNSVSRKDVRQRIRAIEDPDVFINKEDFESGFVEGEDGLGIISDADLYVPFFFEDMRKVGRRIYFRAFLTQFRESITPEWAQEKFYGRIDPVAIYKNTSRSFSIGFTIAAMSPAGFSTMWKKVNNLSKMLYPSYSNGIMIKSPVIRLRIGDVLCDGAGLGLPGYISSPLELDYSDSPWEVEEFSGPTAKPAPGIEMGKAPMIIKVSLTFQVIHEANPQIDDDYNFDSTNFRRIGTLQDLLEDQEPTELSSPDVEDTTRSDDSIGEQ